MCNDTFQNERKLIRELKNLGAKNAAIVTANYLVEKDPTKNCLSQGELDTIEFIKSIVPLEQLHNLGKALFLGKDKLQATYNLLMELCPEKEVKYFYNSRSVAFSIEIEEVQETISYLKSLQFDEKEIAKILISAIQLSIEELKERCELALEYWNDKNFLYHLINNCLFYPYYYVDPKECLNTLVKELGLSLAKKLLENEELYIYYWKNKAYRNDLTYGPQFQEALKILEKYKQNK